MPKGFKTDLTKKNQKTNKPKPSLTFTSTANSIILHEQF